MRKRTRLFILVVGLFLLLSLQGCSNPFNARPAPTPTPLWEYQVSPIFRDLYQRLGGGAVLGSAVSEQKNFIDGTLCQYLEKVLICADPAANELDRVFLAPIGYDVLGVKPIPPSPEIRIYDAFLPAYRDRFFGARYVGKALTEVRYDSTYHRLIQYFEKMAFSLDLSNPKAEVVLLPYGATVHRRDNPRVSLPVGSSIGPAQITDIPSAASLVRLGGFETLGKPLSKPYPEKDAISEQLFENALVYIPKDNPNTVRLRDLSQRIGMIYTPPAAQKYTLKDNMLFYITQGNLGYHVPIYFDQFIATHGGLEISGAPISEPVALEINGKVIARQCFQNICLDYDRTPSDGVNVRLAPIGKLYQQKIQPENKTFTLSSQTITLRTTEQQPRIANDQTQIIDIFVQKSQNNQPLADVESFITLNSPDGKRLSYNLPPTNTSGKSHIVLQPMYGAANAQIIPYIVCLNLPTEEPVCSPDTFMIWNLK